MPVRSTTDEFGWKVETTAQTPIALTSGDFGMQIFEPSIQIAGDPEAVDPAANADRPLYYRKTQRTANVSFKQALTRGVLAAVPDWFALLQACGFSVAGSVATLGAIADNSKSISCELYDGILKSTAWGVRGLPKIGADKPSDPVLLSFNGKGHGTKAKHTAWPSGITDNTTPRALFENNSMTLGGYIPELLSCSFDLVNDPTILTNALATDGIIEPYLVKPQPFLRTKVYLHSPDDRDWYSYVTDAATNRHAVSWGIDLGGGKEVVIAGMTACSKYPNETRENGVGVVPLEFHFLRGTDVTITYQDKA